MSDGPIDPRLVNCASGACCPSVSAFAATLAINLRLGLDDDAAAQHAKAMHERGIRYVTADLADAIARFVDHPRRHVAVEEVAIP